LFGWLGNWHWKLSSIPSGIQLTTTLPSAIPIHSAPYWAELSPTTPTASLSHSTILPADADVEFAGRRQRRLVLTVQRAAEMILSFLQ
jgi:hypothetical protein